MNDPTDKELLEFVARFAGWTDIQFPVNRDGEAFGIPSGHQPKSGKFEVPNYLHSVDAWLLDVWPKVCDMLLTRKWYENLKPILGPMADDGAIANADARSRCLALWLAWEEKLP